jgi:hypothetical protein
MRLSFSATILSLVIALISVVASTAPLIKDLLTPVNSKFVVAFQGAERETVVAPYQRAERQARDNLVIAVLVSNTGIRPGTMTAAADVSLPGWVSSPLQIVPVEPPSTARVIEPGKSTLFRYSITASRQSLGQWAALQAGKSEMCSISLRSVDYTGNQEPPHHIVLPCGLFIEWYEGRAMQKVSTPNWLTAIRCQSLWA